MSKRLLSKKGERLLREMRDSGELCCIELYSDYNFVWDVSFVRAEQIGDPHKKERSRFSFEDLNEAIAEAYKLWKAGPKRVGSSKRSYRAGIVPFD